MLESTEQCSSRSEAFGAASHPAYSSFSHIGDVQNLSFAVGLREDPENVEKWVEKILPMCKIIPGKPVVEREKRRGVGSVEVDLIEVPEILEMRGRLAAILKGNENLSDEHDQLAIELADALSSLEAIEKRSAMLDEEVEDLNDQLTEERNKSLVASMDAKCVIECNDELRRSVQREIQTLRDLETELEEKTNQLAKLRECSDIQMVFGGGEEKISALSVTDRELERLQVSKLDRWTPSETRMQRRQ